MLRRILPLLILLLLPTAAPAGTWMDPGQLPDATRRWKTEHLDVIEARKSIGYPDDLARDPSRVMREKFPIVIIDSGFVGIQDYWKAHPKKRKHILSFITFYKEGKKAVSHHGFEVYQAALMDSPDADFHLFQVDHSDPESFHRALAYMAKKKLFQANYSAGAAAFVGPFTAYNDKIYDWLEKYQVFLFQSAGNDRGKAHYFQYQDANNNNLLEFVPQDGKTPVEKLEFNPFMTRKGREVQVKLRWNPALKDDFKDRVEFMALTTKGKVLAATRDTRSWGMLLKFTPDKDQPALLRVKDLGILNPRGKDLALHFSRGMAGKYKNTRMNGFGVVNRRAMKESPFIISVGSYGKGEDGKLMPSPFSCYGKTVDGQLLPHILGPGQLRLGDKKIQGTSFSAPFISSFFTKFSGYNTKNLVESVSSKEKFSDKALPVERGRWGIPDVIKTNRSDCFVGDRIDGLTSKIQGETLTVDFKLSRRCMEKIRYRLGMTLHVATVEDRVQVTVEAKEKEGDPLVYFTEIRKSSSRDIAEEPFTITVPLADLKGSYGGNWAWPKFSIQTANTGDRRQDLRVPNRFKPVPIPIDTAAETGLAGKALFDKAMEYARRGAFGDALRLIDAGLAQKPDFSWGKPGLDTILETKAFCLLFTNQPAQAMAFMDKAEPSLKAPTPSFYALMAALHYLKKDFQTVRDIAARSYTRSKVHPDLALLAHLSARQMKAPPPKVPAFEAPDDPVLFQAAADYMAGKTDQRALWDTVSHRLKNTTYGNTRAGLGARSALISYLGAEKNGLTDKKSTAQLRQALNSRVIFSPWVVLAKYQLGKIK